MYFGRKNVETKQRCSHELAFFLKYHIPSNRRSCLLINVNSLYRVNFFPRCLNRMGKIYDR